MLRVMRTITEGMHIGMTWPKMIRVAEALSRGIKHVRVDLYDTQMGVRFGELTFFDQSGFADDYVGDGDRVMGEFLKLEEQA